MRYPSSSSRCAAPAAAPETPLPFSTRTRTCARERSGCVGGGATCGTSGAAACAVDCACEAAACRPGARCTTPTARSATSSARATAPRTIVAARHGDVDGMGWACCTARTGSRRRSRFLLQRGRRDPVPRLGEAVVERMLGTPAELARRERDVEDAPLQLAEPRGLEVRLALDAGDALDRVVE